MIYQTVNESDFVRAFDDMGRGDSFTPLARCVLFEYYEEVSESVDEGIELDPVAICCDWAEYTAEELTKEFGHLVDRDDDMDEDEYFADILEYVQEDGVLLEVHHFNKPSTYLFSE